MGRFRFENEKDNCADRPLGTYLTKKRGQWLPAEFTEYGWRVEWSNWYQNDSDFEEIGVAL